MSNVNQQGEEWKGEMIACRRDVTRNDSLQGGGMGDGTEKIERQMMVRNHCFHPGFFNG